MGPALQEVACSLTDLGERLVLRAWPAHLMVAMLGLSALLVLISIALVPSQPILPCSPSSILGTAILIAQSRELTRLRHSGIADEKELGCVLNDSRFQSSAGDGVGEAIKAQNGIIIAQSLAFNQLPVNLTNATFSDPEPGDNDAQRTLNAVDTQYDARGRVVQDPLSTRVLEG